MRTINPSDTSVDQLVVVNSSAVRASEALRLLQEMYVPEKYRDTGAVILMHLSRLSSDLYGDMGALAKQLEGNLNDQNGTKQIERGECIDAEELFVDIGKDADSYKHLGPPHIYGA